MRSSDWSSDVCSSDLTDFLENRGGVVGPVAHRGGVGGDLGQPAGHEVTEALAGDVDVGVVAVDEVHRHVEQVVDIAFEAEAVLEHEGQHAARSEERRGGKEWVSTCRSRWWP